MPCLSTLLPEACRDTAAAHLKIVCEHVHKAPSPKKMLPFLLFGATSFFLWRLLDIHSLGDLRKRLAALCSGRGQHAISNLYLVDEKSKRHGGELVAAVLKSHGVQEIFTLCGGHISPILVASEGLGIKIIDTRHEVTAVFAADAVARLRQSIGVAAVTAGPGVTNTITAVKNAQMAESPLLLIGGAAPSLLKDRGALQDIDQLVLFRPLCKFAARVTRLRDIVPTLKKAIQAALEGTPGPVFVEFPVDVLYPYHTVVKEIGFQANPKGLVAKAVNAFLMGHVSRQFCAAWEPQDIRPLPATVPEASRRELNKLIALIKNAKRPVLLLGSQSTLGPVQTEELAAAVKLLGIPVYLGGMARGLLGKDCPLQMKQNRKEALKDADLTILGGTVCDFRLSYGRVLSKKSKIVCINRNKDQLHKNEKVFWQANLSIQADVASTLTEAARVIMKLPAGGASLAIATEPNTASASSNYETWVNKLRQMENEKEAANIKKAEQPTTDGNINPLKFLQEMDKVLPDDTILVADGGDFVGCAAYNIRPRGPLQWLDPGAFGTLGVAGGFALGAKAVYPNRPVFILWGDGSAGYSIMEFDTFHRHKLPVTGIIGNDGCWTQIAREQIPMFNSRVAVDLSRVAYDEVAVSLGGTGVKITKDSKEGAKEAIKKALEDNRQGKSSLINVHIGTTDFREGSISV